MSAVIESEMTKDQALEYWAIYNKDLDNIDYSKKYDLCVAGKVFIIFFMVVFILVGIKWSRGAWVFMKYLYDQPTLEGKKAVFPPGAYIPPLLILLIMSVLLPCMLGVYALPDNEKAKKKAKADEDESFKRNKIDKVLELIPELKK